MLKKIKHLKKFFSFNPWKMLFILKELPYFLSQYFKFKKMLKYSKSSFKVTCLYPFFFDRHKKAGVVSDYFYQDLFIAQKVYKNNPKKHLDIGSRIDGFVAHVASFREIEVLDVRGLEIDNKNIKFTQGDITKINYLQENYCDSISCLHALEHFGLGRYGDPLDPEGHLKALDNIHRLLKRGGKFYLSVPVGDCRVEFNGLTYFSVSYLLKCFEGKYQLDSFSHIDKNIRMKENIELDYNTLDSIYKDGLGIFELTKK